MTDTDRIIFFGDSITEFGGDESGYVTLVSNSLRAESGGSSPEIVNAGISGNKVTDLLTRLDSDVISLRPSIVVIYIGINDVWHFSMPGRTGTPRDTYESGIEELIRRLLVAGSRVVLCTPSVIGEKGRGENPQDELLAEYAVISRSLAKKTGAVLCDLNTQFNDYLKEHNPENRSDGVLTVDGVHLNDRGNRLVAEALLNVLKPMLKAARR